MSNFFVDTSALAKRYITELGSAWVRSWIHPLHNNVVIISDLAPVEGSHVFARLLRERRLNQDQQTQLQNVFMLHVEREYLVVPVEGLVLAEAQRLVNRY